MQLSTVKIQKPETINFILGQAHFIKTIEDLHEALVCAIPNIPFGLAFCEASGECLIRYTGTDEKMIKLAISNAEALGSGHCFILFLGEGFFPINVLKTIQAVPEICAIFCATANPVEVAIIETDQGRGIVGVIDGFSPRGIEDEKGIAWRKSLLRNIGYKL
jgi:adenosine/AMP kinase